MIYIVNIQVYEEDLNAYTCVSLLELLLALTPSRNFLLGDLIRENSYRQRGNLWRPRICLCDPFWLLHLYKSLCRTQS